MPLVHVVTCSMCIWATLARQQTPAIHMPVNRPCIPATAVHFHSCFFLVLHVSCLQDGTVRVWDCSSYSCISIIHPNPAPPKDAPGSVIPLDQPRLLLKCAKSPGNSCVRFDVGGGWLLIGNTGNATAELFSMPLTVFWRCPVSPLVRQEPLAPLWVAQLFS